MASDAEVEAGSKANFESETDCVCVWEGAHDDVKEATRRGVRIILKAAERVRVESKDAELATLRAELDSNYERESQKDSRMSSMELKITRLESENASMHTEQWHTTECARLVIDMHKRIAADWCEVGRARTSINRLESENAALKLRAEGLEREVRASRGWRAWRSMAGGPDQSELRQEWDEAIIATDAANALEKP